MKRIIVALAILLMVQTGTNFVFADAQTNLQRQYIEKIQAAQIPFSSLGFMQAIKNNDPVIVEDFIRAGMSPNSTWGKVPAIFMAINSGSDKALKVLIANGANVNKNVSGWTPLMLSINRKQPTIADILISNGADINSAVSGDIPINYALKKKQLKIAKSLLSAGAKTNDETIVRAVKSKDTAIKNAVFKQYNQ